MLMEYADLTLLRIVILLPTVVTNKVIGAYSRFPTAQGLLVHNKKKTLAVGQYEYSSRITVTDSRKINYTLPREIVIFSNVLAVGANFGPSSRFPLGLFRRARD